ncbi:MAG: glycosyltransferase family 4 protein [Pseudomonadota bacterium]
MRILLSAFAYSPILGSECGVGWHWARVLAQHHDVTVLTHAWFREDVERALAEQPQPRLKVVYFTVDPWLGQFSRPLLDSQLYYVWWQWKVVPFARELHAQMQFDVVHHLTWGSLRYPSWLGRIGARFIVGPLGGGERAPARFFAGLPLKERLKEVLRDAVLYSFKLDPFTQRALSKAERIFSRTQDTARFLPQYLSRKTTVAHEIGAPLVKTRPVRERRKTTTFLFAGRLIPFKGLHLALPAIAEAVRQGADVRLVAVGDGPLRDFLLAQAARLGLGDRFDLRDRIPQAELMDLYLDSDAFLFPSLHDSGGTVVLEALSRGLPVICLDLGGPACFVDDACGVVVSTQGRSQAELVMALADAVVAHARRSDPDRLAMCVAAAARATRLSWEKQVESVYGALDDR